MNKVTIIEDNLEGFNGDACLVMDTDGNFFVVSTVTAAQFAHVYGGSFETLAFRADEEGNILSWADVAGGGDMTREDVIAQIEDGDLYDWSSEEDSYFYHDPDSLYDIEDYVGEDEEYWSNLFEGEL